jgi:hypothetical protein
MGQVTRSRKAGCQHKPSVHRWTEDDLDCNQVESCVGECRLWHSMATVALNNNESCTYITIFTLHVPVPNRYLAKSATTLAVDVPPIPSLERAR